MRPRGTSVRKKAGESKKGQDNQGTSWRKSTSQWTCQIKQASEVKKWLWEQLAERYVSFLLPPGDSKWTNVLRKVIQERERNLWPEEAWMMLIFSYFSALNPHRFHYAKFWSSFFIFSMSPCFVPVLAPLMVCTPRADMQMKLPWASKNKGAFEVCKFNDALHTLHTSTAHVHKPSSSYSIKR